MLPALPVTKLPLPFIQAPADTSMATLLPKVRSLAIRAIEPPFIRIGVFGQPYTLSEGEVKARSLVQRPATSIFTSSATYNLPDAVAATEPDGKTIFALTLISPPKIGLPSASYLSVPPAINRNCPPGARLITSSILMLPLVTASMRLKPCARSEVVSRFKSRRGASPKLETILKVLPISGTTVVPVPPNFTFPSKPRFELTELEPLPICSSPPRGELAAKGSR